MPLPWSAPGYGQGIFPSQASFPGQRVDPELIQAILRDRAVKQAQQQEAMQQGIQAIGQIVQQRHQDAIASQLLAGSAPRAEAVGAAPPQQTAPAAPPPSQEFQDLYGTMSPSGQPIAPATPPAALTSFRPVGAAPSLTPAQEMAQNARLGYDTRQVMRPSELYAYREHEQAQNLSDMYTRARIAHALGLGTAGGGLGGGGPTVTPQVDPKTGLIWTGRGWVKPPHMATTKAGTVDPAVEAQVKNTLGFGFKELGTLALDQPYVSATETPRSVRYIDAKGTQVAGVEGTGAAPEGSFAVGTAKGQYDRPIGFKVPAKDWNNIMSVVKGRFGGGTATGGSGEPADGTFGTVQGQPAVWRSGIGWVAR